MSTYARHRAAMLKRGLVLTAVSLSLAACSSNVDRFADYPPVNTTASVPPKANTDTVTRNRLAGVRKTPQSTWQQPDTPAKVAYKPAPQSNGWVTVKSGQTMYSIARANNMSVQQLAAANGIHPPYSVHTGQRLKVPGVSAPNSPAPSFVPRQPQYQAANAPAQAPRNYVQTSGHRVQPGETLFSLGRKYGKNPYAIARYNGLAAPYGLNVGQVVKIPGANSTPPTPPTTAAKAPQMQKAPVKTADRIPQTTPTPRQSPVTQNQTASTFRWPVKGRVISSFGRKPNGLRNEGINISVPAGTSVRAADAGIVAYAGSELKGYGNLVLVRHKNGWVTAYAHNKELFVKRGDTVKRGDVIAKAGQTGSVTSPQLHFEVRKGSAAVDPLKYLGSQTAAAN